MDTSLVIVGGNNMVVSLGWGFPVSKAVGDNVSLGYLWEIAQKILLLLWHLAALPLHTPILTVEVLSSHPVAFGSWWLRGADRFWWRPPSDQTNECWCDRRNPRHTTTPTRWQPDCWQTSNSQIGLWTKILTNENGWDGDTFKRN